MKKRFVLLYVLLITLWLSNPAISQVGDYYNGITTSSVDFVDDLKARVRSPYTKISYDQFDETNVANFASYDKGDGTRGVRCVYSYYEHVYTPTFAWGTMSREHTFCYSWMPSHGSTSTNEYSDQHHLFPTHQNGANGVRSNHPLGIVTTVTSSFLEGKYGKDANGNNVYEPRDQHKGDAARAILYMLLRYDDVNGNNWDMNWLNNVKLPSLSEAPQNLNLLLTWHLEDPPDAWEIARNDYIHSIQKNRNPFVDHPEYVDYIDFNTMAYNPGGGLMAEEPTNHVTNLEAQLISPLSISLSWTDAEIGSQVPSGYIIFISTSEITSPTDGITYSDDLNLSDNNGRVSITHPSTGEYTFSNLIPTTTYYFKIYSFNGSGTQRNYKTDGTIPLTQCATSIPSLATEPTNYPSNFIASEITHSSISLSWDDALPGTQIPSGYLLIASAGQITPPIDAISYSNDNDLSDGYAVVNIDYSASNTYSFSSLSPNTNYSFKLYSFNNIENSINYKTDGTPPLLSVTTLDAKGTDNLIAGDIVIVGFNMTDPDEFAFIPLVNIAGGTQIKFTDNGWLSTGSFRTGEGIKIWNSPAEGVSKGTIINYSDNLFNIGTTEGSGSFLLSTSGDQILAYTEQNSVINFLYAVNNSENSWQANATTANSSALPAGLVNGETAVALIENDNGVYNGGYLFHSEELLLNISNSTNWTMSSTRLTMPSGDVALPVELQNFQGSVIGNDVNLRWETVTEINNYGFEVERSEMRDERSEKWEKIGFVAGNGNSNSVKEYSFTDDISKHLSLYHQKDPLDNLNLTLSYRLKQIDNDGSYTYSNEITVETMKATSLPIEFTLYNNYPNPFNPSTTIKFGIPKESKVILEVFNVLGERVVTLVNKEMTEGYHEVKFNGASLPGGVYIYKLAADGFSATKKLVLMK